MRLALLLLSATEASGFQLLHGARGSRRPLRAVCMTETFPLPPDASYAECLKHAPSVCRQLADGAFCDSDHHLGPMAAFLASSTAAETIIQLQAAGEPLGDALRKEARALQFALLQRLTLLNSFSALKRLALLQSAPPSEVDVARWTAACEAWGYEAEELEELLDKLEPAATSASSST
ncbi:hypothetical protein AB1Y20_022330 [Prymnesium parvum]|uniref:Uncharacterized protein n=1 Tax=Prymnesium parvum TaxID=97485 RepID=A0AB34JJA1_PRYPA